MARLGFLYGAVSEKTSVFAAELRRIGITDTGGGRAYIHAFPCDQLPGLVQADAFQILNRGGRRHGPECQIKVGNAHSRFFGHGFHIKFFGIISLGWQRRK